MEQKSPKPERIEFKSAGALSPQAQRRIEEGRRQPTTEAPKV